MLLAYRQAANADVWPDHAFSSILNPEHPELHGKQLSVTAAFRHRQRLEQKQAFFDLLRMASDLQVAVPQLRKVGPDDLVAVHKDDLAQGQGEQHVQEQDLVRPDDALLLRLQAPGRVCRGPGCQS